MGLHNLDLAEGRKERIEEGVYEVLVRGDYLESREEKIICGLDSLSTQDIVMDIEDRFDISEISAEDVRSLYEGEDLGNNFSLSINRIVDYLAGRNDVRV